MANMLEKIISGNITDITSIWITLICNSTSMHRQFGGGRIRNEKGRVPVGLVFPREYNFFENQIMVIQGASFFEKTELC